MSIRYAIEKDRENIEREQPESNTKLWQENVTQKYDKKMWHKIMTRKGDLVYITQKWVTNRVTEIS